MSRSQVMSHAPSPQEEQLDAFAAELDAIYRRAISTLGESDLRYLKSVVRTQHMLEVVGRCSLQFGRSRLTRAAGVVALTAAKSLDNLEIGHNVIHGQYDWAGDPQLNSASYEWDTAVPARLWRYMHNFVHHTYANVYGLDENLRAGPLRVSARQPWKPYHRFSPLLLLIMAPLAELVITLQVADESCRDSALTDLKTTRKQVRQEILSKAARQAAKDFVLFPLLSGRRAKQTLLANASALALRNIWIFAIAVCSHYPEGLDVYDEEVLDNETRAQWYSRQVRGTANIDGSRLLHILTGHHTHHIEHHLFPNLPSSRYREVSHQVRDVCERHGVPYTTTSFPAQFVSAVRNICSLSRRPRR